MYTLCISCPGGICGSLDSTLLEDGFTKAQTQFHEGFNTINNNYYYNLKWPALIFIVKISVGFLVCIFG